jgi:hypothetical protein
MQELQASLGTIFLTRLATGSILKLAVPYIMQKMKTANETKGVDPDDLTDVELAYIQDVSNERKWCCGAYSAPVLLVWFWWPLFCFCFAEKKIKLIWMNGDLVGANRLCQLVYMRVCVPCGSVSSVCCFLQTA